jgi:hypothetical protein
MAKSDDLEVRRKKIESLKAEAKSYGVYITSDRLSDVSRTVNQIRASREGKPPCYWRSYERTARECRICEVRADCARGETVPVEIATDELQPVVCRKCGSGHLSVELRDPASDDILDYGCTDSECIGTLSEQRRHVSDDEPQKRTRIKAVRNQRGATMDEMKHDIVEYVRTHPGCETRALFEHLPGGAARKQRAIRDLVTERVIRKERSGRKLLIHLVE